MSKDCASYDSTRDVDKLFETNPGKIIRKKVEKN
jgi:hypothetical protein